jgi:hypothetical protein
MKFEVQAPRARKKFLEFLLPSFIEQLNLQSSKKSVIVTTQPDSTHSGLTVELPGADMYMVVIKSSLSFETTGIALAHEMVHVQQFARGVLKSLKGGKNSWNGKVYSSKVSYLDRPWEIKAFQQQELLFRRAID